MQDLVTKRTRTRSVSRRGRSRDPIRVRAHFLGPRSDQACGFSPYLWRSLRFSYLEESRRTQPSAPRRSFRRDIRKTDVSSPMSVSGCTAPVGCPFLTSAPDLVILLDRNALSVCGVSSLRDLHQVLTLTGGSPNFCNAGRELYSSCLPRIDLSRHVMLKHVTVGSKIVHFYT